MEGKGGDVVFEDRYDAVVYAKAVLEKILENSNFSATPDEVDAERIADFIETLADRLTKKG